MVANLLNRGIDIKLRTGHAKHNRILSKRSQVTNWSRKSARNLLYVCAHANFQPTCMMTLTYHTVQTDGVKAKSDLKTLLQRLKRHFHLQKYLWVMEFQSRGAIHFHLWASFTFGADESDYSLIQRAWVQISEQSDDPDALEYAACVEGCRQPHSLIYYATKEIASAKFYQKVLPNGIEGAGRWWGRSRNVEIESYVLEITPGQAKLLDAFIRSKWPNFPGYGRVIFLFDADLALFKAMLQRRC